jgi:hypothetical protein
MNEMAAPVFLEQVEFRQVLHLEGKRAERSGAAFVLVLIEAPELFGDSTVQPVCARVMDELCSSLRDTDVRGWYTAETTVGVIFTESDPGAVQSIGQLLVKDLRDRLASALPENMPDDFIRFSYSVFPRTAETSSQREPRIVGRR